MYIFVCILGCPFRHTDSNLLKQRLAAYKINQSGIDEVRKEVHPSVCLFVVFFRPVPPLLSRVDMTFMTQDPPPTLAVAAAADARRINAKVQTKGGHGQCLRLQQLPGLSRRGLKIKKKISTHAGLAGWLALQTLSQGSCGLKGELALDHYCCNVVACSGRNSQRSVKLDVTGCGAICVVHLAQA